MKIGQFITEVQNWTLATLDKLTRKDLRSTAVAIRPADTEASEEVALEDLIKRNLIAPGYEGVAKAALEDAKKSKTGAFSKCWTIHLKITFRTLLILANANGRNRPRNWQWVAFIAYCWQRGLKTYLTDFAVTNDRLVSNGGHSGPGGMVAMCPPDVLQWAKVEGIREIDPDTVDDDEPTYHVVYKIPHLVDDAENGSDGTPLGFQRVERITYTGEGELEALSDAEREADYEYYVDRFFEKHPTWQREIRVCFGTPNHAVTEYDTVGRERKPDEQLAMFAPSAAFVAAREWLSLMLFSQILRMLYLRSKKERPEKIWDNGSAYHFGGAGAGSRTGSEKFPVFFLAFLARLLRLDYVHRNYGGESHLIYVSRNYPALIERPKGEAKLEDEHYPIAKNLIKDFAVAICVLSPSEGKALCDKLVAGDDATLKALSNCIANAATAGDKRPDADKIQAYLVHSAKGLKPLPPSKMPRDSQGKMLGYHVLTASRGSGWDVASDENGEAFNTQACHESALAVDAWFGDNLDRSESFREKGKPGRPRKAKAKTAKKRTA